MRPVDAMITALQDYYGLQYREKMRSVIRDALATLPREYLIELYTGIINTHSVQYKQLPDMAIIRKVQDKMGAVATYLTPSEEEVPYDPALDEQIKRELAEKKRRDGEANHYERQRIRDKVRKGEASKYEVQWIRCVDEFGGNWRRMIAATGGV